MPTIARRRWRRSKRRAELRCIRRCRARTMLRRWPSRAGGREGDCGDVESKGPRRLDRTEDRCHLRTELDPPPSTGGTWPRRRARTAAAGGNATGSTAEAAPQHARWRVALCRGPCPVPTGAPTVGMAAHPQGSCGTVQSAYGGRLGGELKWLPWNESETDGGSEWWAHARV